MIGNRTYLALSRFALALAMFASSSGFTMVLHSCLMEDRACCDAMDSGAASRSSAGSADARFVKVPSSCCDDTIVGGLNRATATLDTHSSTSGGKTVLAVVNPVLAVGQPQETAPATGFLQFRPPDPPTCGLFISNSSLLI